MTQDEEKRFIEILENTDWFYMYAEGRNYNEGRKTVEKVVHYRDFLIHKYPEDEESIKKIFNEYSR